jgi:dihydrofolate reductase
MRIAIIAAVARNGVIGREGRLPWRLPDDLKRFKQLTQDHAVIMGRVTYESIGLPLPRRQNIVVSRSHTVAPAGCLGANSLATALALVDRRDECFVIGGAQLYKEAIPLAHRMYLTQIAADTEGDVRFPAYDERPWRVIAREPHPADAKHEYAFEFVTLERAPA